MYTEDGERRRFPILSFIAKLVLIIIFVLLLVWLLPKPNLSGLNDRIFKDNVRDMKEAAENYFTTDRLPQEEGDSVTMTLQEMLDKKLLLPFKDKDGKSCDTQNSYVKITKMEEEYELKVYLKCGKDEDYIIVHLGCYAYCEKEICEKREDPKEVVEKTKNPTNPKKPTVTPTPKPTPTPTPSKPTGGNASCTLEIASGNKGENGWYIGDVVIRFKSKSTNVKGATITGYGIGTSQTYGKNTTYKVTKDGNTTVYGYVKDSKGNTAVCSIAVKRDTKKPDCSLGVLSGTKNSEGYITDVKVGFTSRTDVTSGIANYGVINSSKETYNKKTNYLVTAYGTTKVYGYVKDNAGNKAVCSTSVKKVKVPEDKYSVPSCELQVSSGTKGNNDWYRSNVVVKFKSKKTTNGATITGYGIGTSQTYGKNTTYTISKDGSRTIYGYVKDSKGNTAVCSIKVKRDATRPNCELKVQSGSYSNGYYTSNVVIGFRSKSDATSGMNAYGIGKSTTYGNNTTYKITSDGTHTVYGYVKDNAGNTNTCSIKVIKKNIQYEYEYLKTWSTQYSAWSGWTVATYSKSNPPKFEKTDTKITEDLGSKKVSDGYTYKVGSPIYGSVVKKSASIKQKVCNGYDYYRTSTTSSKTYAVKVASNDGWVYKDTRSYKEKPADTLSTKYVYAGVNWSACSGSCTSTPYKLFKVYTRTIGTVTATDTITLSTGVKVKCSGYSTKTIYSFSTYSTIIGFDETRTEKFKTIYEYRYKTRTITKKAGSSVKWSTANDQALIKDGYKLTGQKRQKG